MRTVIIGNGGAAAESVTALRGSGYTSEIHVFSDVVFPAFNPTLLTYYIAGKIELEGIFPFGGDPYARYGVTLHSGSAVVQLDALNKTVENAAGLKMSWDNCIVCSGASPVIPEVYKDKGVYTIRSVPDATALKKQISPGKKALVAGASLIGVKVVEALSLQGVEVSLTDTQSHVLPMSACAGCAALIERTLEKNGVQLHLGTDSDTDSPDLSRYDFIVLCAGTRPNIDFIDKAQVNTAGGVITDKFMRANRSGLYAAGDAACVRDGAYEYVAPGLWAGARLTGRAAGRNIAGKNEACIEVTRHNNSCFFGLDFASAGDISKGDDIFEMESGGRYCAIAWKDGRIVGVNLLNMPEISGIIKSWAFGIPKLSNIVLSKVFNKYPPVKDAFLSYGSVSDAGSVSGSSSVSDSAKF